MKNFMIFSFLLMLSVSAHADIMNYDCDGGVKLKVDYSENSGDRSIDGLILLGTHQDGSYSLLGDGFVMVLKGHDSITLTLDDNLFTVQRSGKIALSGDNNWTTCEAQN